MAQGAQGVGLAGAGQPEGQHVDAALHKAALGQVVQLLPHGQGYAVLLEDFPGLARGQPGLPAQPVDAPVAAILSFLFQHLQESMGRASPCPAAVKRATDWAPMVGSLKVVSRQ